MKKEKEVVKSKEQIAHEMKQVQEVLRLRKFSQKKFFPFLKKHTKSISDARTFLQIIDTVVKGAFNEGLSTTTVGSLGIEKKIKETAPDAEQEKFREVLAMFEGESVMSFIKIVSDFEKVIGGLVQEWESRGKLSDLKSPFPDEKK